MQSFDWKSTFFLLNNVHLKPLKSIDFKGYVYSKNNKIRLNFKVSCFNANIYIYIWVCVLYFIYIWLDSHILSQWIMAGQQNLSLRLKCDGWIAISDGWIATSHGWKAIVAEQFVSIGWCLAQQKWQEEAPEDSLFQMWTLTTSRRFWPSMWDVKVLILASALALTWKWPAQKQWMEVPWCLAKTSWRWCWAWKQTSSSNSHNWGMLSPWFWRTTLA